MDKPKSAIFLYDGECPFCQRFKDYYLAKKALPELQVMSLRDDSWKKLNLPVKLDPNQGMILILNDNVFQGDEALQVMSKLIQFERMNDLIFTAILKHKILAKLFYPLAKLLRLVALIILRKKVKLN